jgi:endonuclease/exonuclease/phosphatase family metal-dependent hydrolase
MRSLNLMRTVAWCGALLLLGASGGRAEHRPHPTGCDARRIVVDLTTIAWHGPPPEDETGVDRWCRGVGPPVLIPSPVTLQPAAVPDLGDLGVISWNAHLAGGQLATLVDAVRSGRLTGGVAVPHFVLLLQEVYRRGTDVPAFAPDARSAFAIAARDPHAPDIRDYASMLGLSTFYVPSMRNGAELLEDRGSAIMSTEPLHDLLALELPFERQRRVAVGASVSVRRGPGVATLNLLTAHLEPLSAPTSLWLFRNPRPRQVAAILALLRQPAFAYGDRAAGSVLGGDFNTVQGGDDEGAYMQARAWSTSLESEDTRRTHAMGRIDYVFFRLDPGWVGTTTRVDERFGSDHHPVLGRFVRQDGRH